MPDDLGNEFPSVGSFVRSVLDPQEYDVPDPNIGQVVRSDSFCHVLHLDRKRFYGRASSLEIVIPSPEEQALFLLSVP